MKMIQGLRTWWQKQTGEDETPFDGDSPAFIVSLLTHLAIVVALGLTPLVVRNNQVTLTVVSVPETEEVVELKVPEEFYFADQPSQEVGANSVQGESMALSEAPIISEVSVIPSHHEILPEVEVANVEINNAIEVATGLHYNANMAVKGAAGEGTTGAVGAIDRLTHEILLSLEERKTLVVWCFDSTASLIPQRNAIHDRFDKIYEELGIIEAAGNKAFKKHEDEPLLSSIVAFGNNVELVTKKPTSSLSDLKSAVKGIKNDDSGNENVFRTVYEVAKNYANLRYAPPGGQPERNVMIVVFTDEAGSDQIGLDETVKLCRRHTMPVYVVGVPAPFGRKETQMKWVDPDPKYDQSPKWGVVEQGPESLAPERIKLNFSGSKEDELAIDSGFGPYSLTRLCVETGGIYFAVHPNRDVRRAVSRQETQAFSSHISQFFDPEVMRRYRPDYVSTTEYQKRVSSNKARFVLVEAAKMSQLDQMGSPNLRFVKSDEAAFATALSEAQQEAARLEPKINQLYEVLRTGESDREKEDTPRWQAGYDLAMGRVLAVKVRTEAYNAMLAAAKRGLKPKDPKNNTWTLKPADEISVGSQLAKLGERARMYLNRVVKDHPGTPWALLADKELKDPVGWVWVDSFTDLAPRKMGDGGNGNAPAAVNDAKMMLKKPAPSRPPPKL
ncbi:MAG: vWA domain-containing protein [Pirellulaceae bacterium]